MSEVMEMSCEFGSTFPKGGKSDFNGSVYVSEQLNRQMINMVQEFALRCVSECASRYNFDAEEAIRSLGLSMLKVERKSVSGSGSGSESKLKSKEPKIVSMKAAFPLPYNGEFAESCCYALRQNNGLYTQCQGNRRKGSDYCKSCLTTMEKTGSEIPEYGTIQGRRAVDIFEYVDPKGRKPTAYTKVMKKYKITEEQVLEEAGKLNIIINPNHFVAPEETKRGRPSSNKEPKEKGVKGRPKKSKKVVEVDGDEEDDLFATLVANANEDAEEEILVTVEDKAEKEAKLAAEKAEKEAEKAEKEAKKAAEKAEKEAKKAAEKAEKEAKIAAEKAAKEAEKEAKKAAEKAAKEEKEAKLAAEKAAKEATKSSKKAKAAPAKEEEEEEEPETVKKIEYEGKKYLMSKKSGVVYDYNKYIKEGDLVIVGVWNKNSNKLDFKATEDDSDEESEDEYDD